MPKIIRDVKKDIFLSAMQLFCEFGYDGVDMKMIAEKCNIAVGTLYNYYPNKNELFLNILKVSWEDTFLKLNKINMLNMPSKQKMRKFIEVIYNTIEKRRGIGWEVKKTKRCTHPKKDNNIGQFMQVLFTDMSTLISSMEKKDKYQHDPSIDIKLSEILLVSTVIMVDAHPQEKQKNIDYLCDLINTFIL